MFLKYSYYDKTRTSVFKGPWIKVRTYKNRKNSLRHHRLLIQLKLIAFKNSKILKIQKRTQILTLEITIFKSIMVVKSGLDFFYIFWVTANWPGQTSLSGIISYFSSSSTFFSSLMEWVLAGVYDFTSQRRLSEFPSINRKVFLKSQKDS